MLRKPSRCTMFAGPAVAALLAAPGLAMLAGGAADRPTDARTEIVTTHQDQAPQVVTQEGTLIAVSMDSLTARSADGHTQMYRLTPATNVITVTGSRPASAISLLNVNDEVDIVGTVQSGTALATAVADRTLGHGEGPPMDDVSGPPAGDGAE
jgi:hypothetical protein